MKLHRLHAVQRLPLSPAAAWDFFVRPENLPLITPPWLGFELTCRPPEAMYAGLILTYRLRPALRLPVRWVTEITHVEVPHFFVDEQRFGPYRFWHHQHHFRAVEGGVEMTDEVHYALPLGPLGGAVHALSVRRRLDDIFRFRRAALTERFGEASA